MKYCKTCKLTYQAPIEHCLFCNGLLEPVKTESGDHAVLYYPAYKKSRHVGQIVKKLIEFLVIIATVTCFSLDLIDQEHGLSWSLYVISSLFYVWYLCVLFGGKKKRIQKVTNASYATIVLILVIGLIGENSFWAIDFILPLGILALNLGLMLYFIIAKRKALHDVIIYPFIASIYGMIPFVLLLCHKLVYTWPSLVCGLYSLAVFACLLFFSTRQTREELIRRLHL